ncbi:MAG: CDP-alcohol phosphatidyltransferase family protein [Bdellovibrionota bacterium]
MRAALGTKLFRADTGQERLPSTNENRRPLATRSATWAKKAAGWMLAAGATPNKVSVASIGCAVLAGASFLFSASAHHELGRALALIAAGGFIQLRLLCNLLDGMLAVEGGLKSPVGELYNDVPDRVSDIIICLAAGAAAHESIILDGMTIGWLAALVSVMTAYVRMLGAATTGSHCFIGPMAKQHRMALLTGACIASGVAGLLGTHLKLLAVALWVIVGGGTLTCLRRLLAISEALKIDHRPDSST